jgi:hypothetical protein
MVEISAGTLIGIGATIFLSLFGIGIKVLYDISVGVEKMSTNVENMNRELGNKLENVNSELQRIEDNTAETNKTLARLDERSESERSDGGFIPTTKNISENQTQSPIRQSKTEEPLESDAEIIEESTGVDPPRPINVSHSSDWGYFAGIKRRISDLAEQSSLDEWSEPKEDLEASSIARSGFVASVTPRETHSQVVFEFPEYDQVDKNLLRIVASGVIRYQADDEFEKNFNVQNFEDRIVIDIPIGEVEDAKHWTLKTLEDIVDAFDDRLDSGSKEDQDDLEEESEGREAQ